MKTIQLAGNRNKSDFTIYLSHILTKLGKNVLIVDATKQSIYRYGYTHLTKSQHLYDFQQIDILCDAKNWLDVEKLLRAEGDSTTQYDLIIVDMDHKGAIEQEWPEFDERYYVGDDERLNQNRDVELLNYLFDITKSNEIKRVIFKSSNKFHESQFDSLMNHRPVWRSMNYTIEPDEFAIGLAIQMQHEQHIPLNRISKQYKKQLEEIISELYKIHVNEVKNAIKPSFFRFGKTKMNETNENELNVASNS
ncbi:hypothetical protein MHH81_21040 [Psychrobacillus sp. FSL H8-0484]|uniref:hypothetical protein n=1 Tax=Psychrobacillus sp. FSL H8-0484 TaxID=2921390 RepID=UPI0030FA242A